MEVPRDFLLFILFTAYLTSQGLLVITTDTENKWKIKLFGGYYLGFYLCLCKVPGYRRHYLIFFPPREPESVAFSRLMSSALKAPSGLVFPSSSEPFPCGFAAPSSSKEGNRTKLENNPTIATTETPNKQMGKPVASCTVEAHFLLQNSALLRNFLMTNPRQTTSSSM